MSSPSSISALAKGLIADAIKLDVLVNNAGIALDGFDAEVARRTIETNFLGPLRVTDGLLDLISAGGNIVMVSSGAGELSGFPASLRMEFLSPAMSRDRLVGLMSSFCRRREERTPPASRLARIRLPGVQGRPERVDASPRR